MEDELELIRNADRRAQDFNARIGTRPVFPGPDALAALDRFDEALPDDGNDAADTLELLDTVGSPATTASNDPRYFGFVVGSTLPVAAAADRLALAWDQCASSFDNSPAAATLERIAGRWLTEILDLPTSSAVGFTTSATAGTLTAIATARRAMLARQGWDVDRRGLAGAPEIKAVVSDLAHITVKKALRVLGFGLDNLVIAPNDEHGRVDPERLPALDERTILILQAGEVNTGEFDPFSELIPTARRAGAWVHVDGAFGLWARASRHRHLTDGVDQADSWTTDAHKWLNTPYDGAMVICRDPEALAQAMNADADYATSPADSQKNLNLEFSRRARGIPVWAALRTLGRDGVADLVERTVDLAGTAGERLSEAGFTVLNRVVLNQVLVRADTPEETVRIREAAQRSGRTWFGPAVWDGEPAFRISVSSWRTRTEHIDDLIDLLVELRSP